MALLHGCCYFPQTPHRIRSKCKLTVHLPFYVALVNSPSNYWTECIVLLVYWFCSLMETLLCGTILRFNNRYYLENEIVFTHTCKCIKGKDRPSLTCPVLNRTKMCKHSVPHLYSLIWSYLKIYLILPSAAEKIRRYLKPRTDYVCFCFLSMGFKRFRGAGLIHMQLEGNM